MDWTQDLRPRPPQRRYPFWARRDRRRAAQALAAGRAPEEVALVERVSVLEVETLLRDSEFDALLAHYRAVAALPKAERLARLAHMALEILELALETGDLRVAMFVLHEQEAGRDPARTVALALDARMERAAAKPAAPRPEPRPRARHEVPPPRDWDHCAAVHETAEHAEGLALERLRTVRQAHRGVLGRLAQRLEGEAERMGTGLGGIGSPLLRREALARGVARYWHERPAQSLRAAERLQARRRDQDFGSDVARLGPRGPGPPD